MPASRKRGAELLSVVQRMQAATARTARLDADDSDDDGAADSQGSHTSRSGGSVDNSNDMALKEAGSEHGQDEGGQD